MSHTQAMKHQFPLTRVAIEAYDAFDATFETALDEADQEKVTAWFKEQDRLGEAVGVAFGVETSDINSVETCRGCIRPGHKIPGPGCEESFVRKAVRKWEEGQNA